jgi:hypothetical protein
MKVCICLIGQMRTFESQNIITSYKKYFSRMEVDLIVNTWNKRGHSNHHNFNDVDTSKTNDVITEFGLMTHYLQFPFNIKKINVNNFEQWYTDLDNNRKVIYESKMIHQGRIYNPKHNTSVPIEFLYQQTMTFISEGSYDRVIIMRPDMAIVDNFRISKNDDPNTIYFQCPCIPCIDHGWWSSQSTIIRHLHDIFDKYLENKEETNSTDNNVLLHHQARKNNIKIQAYASTLFEQIL